MNLSASAGKPAAEGSDIANVDSEWPKNCKISAASVPHLEEVHSNLWQKIGRKSGDNVNALDTNSLIWRMFVSATVDAAVCLGTIFLENLHSTKNQAQRTTRILFDASQKLITDQTEIQGVSKKMVGTHTLGKGQLC